MYLQFLLIEVCFQGRNFVEFFFRIVYQLSMFWGLEKVVRERVRFVYIKKLLGLGGRKQWMLRGMVDYDSGC